MEPSMKQHTGILGFLLAVVAFCGLGAGCVDESSEGRGQAALRQLDCAQPVSTVNGAVEGIRQRSVCAFKGIPYAEPPVGGLRFKPPQSAKALPKSFKTSSFKSDCIQALAGNAIGSEDCLYLNVWIPGETSDGQRASGLPVMVWIHGGGYVMGGASFPAYDGEYLAAKGVTLVSLNYRLGPFGFLAPSNVTDANGAPLNGNLGLLDQIAALQWVKANVAAFGGNPDNVTIFGESAGGGSVCALMASPKASGLFHRAIMESGGCTVQSRMEIAVKSDAWVQGAGCPVSSATSMDCLRSLDAITLPVHAPYSMITTGKTPNVDGEVLTEQPLTALENGAASGISFLAGFNQEETYALRFLPGNQELVKMTFAELWMRLRTAIGVSRTVRVQELFADFAPRDAMELATMLLDDLNFACSPFGALKAQRRHDAEAYYYRFSLGEDELTLESVAGTFHSVELPFVFGTIRALHPFYPDDAAWTRALAMSERMQRYWIRFAATGNPNGGADPLWPAFGDAGERLEIAPDSSTSSGGQAERCAFWAEIVPRSFGAQHIFLKELVGFQLID